MTPLEIAIEIAGWAGALLILLAYLLLSVGRLTGQSIVYQGMNVVGAAGKWVEHGGGVGGTGHWGGWESRTPKVARHACT